MAFHHKMFTIKYSFHPGQGIWHDRDSYEHTGYAKERRTDTYLIVAPSKEVAESHFRERQQYVFSEGHKMTLDEIKEAHVDAFVVSFDLD